MTTAVLPASFDPITCGHVDIATRAARLFDRLIVAVHAHPKKNVLFPIDVRLAMVRDSLSGAENIEVVKYDGLTVDLVRKLGANVLIRGLRAVSDFESEYQQATLNHKMLPSLEVMCMFASMEYSFLSSSIVKEIAEYGGDVSWMVPEAVLVRLRERFPAAAAPVGVEK
ncbi:MAG: pantetheine-phosphate adenylyltransferase [Chloroflexota bacterium]